MNAGNLLMIISLIFAVGSAVLRAVSFKAPKASAWAKALAYAAAGTLTAALLLMVYYLAVCDFTYNYVAAHTELSLKTIYRISALWAGQEGSIMLWAAVTMIVRLFGLKDKKADMVYSIICICLLALATASNPFAAGGGQLADGSGLNEALQDPWMVVHPPLVFISYSTMGMLFSKGFTKVERSWLFASLFFLSLGIMTGSIWAYRELGWGGYWAWDPIENAALIPWLIMCALVHKKKISNASAMAPFMLAVLCTYLARSGVLKQTSVHAYAKSYIGPMLLSLLGGLLIAVLIFAILNRRKKEEGKKAESAKSMDIFIISLYVYTACILAGTLLPVISGATLDMAFYNWYSIIFIIIASAAIIAYRYANMGSSFLYISIGAGTLLTIGSAVALNFWQPLWLVLLCLVFTVIFVEILSIKRVKSIWQSISHIGFFMMTAGIIASSAMGKEGILLTPANYEGVNIVHKFFCDIIIQEGAIYSTKPLIWLFWLGAAMMMGGICGVVLRCCVGSKSRIKE